jgi:hypothetical protein
MKTTPASRESRHLEGVPELLTRDQAEAGGKLTKQPGPRSN